MPSVKWGIDEPLGYYAALELLEKSDSKKGRTLNWGGLRLYLKEVDDTSDATVVIRKGCVPLVEMQRDLMKLNQGHWRSNLAFKAMNAFCPFPIGERDQNWFVLRPGTKKPWLMFVDGITIHMGGKVEPSYVWDPQIDPDPGLSAWPVFERYIETFVAAIGRGERMVASADGCWQCYYYTTREIDGSPLPRGSEPGGVTHLFEHAAKGEPQASLLWRALQESGLNPFARWDTVVGSQYTSSDLLTARDVLTNYFRRRLGLLGAYHFKAVRLKRGFKSHDSTGSKGTSRDVGKHSDGPTLQPSSLVPRL